MASPFLKWNYNKLILINNALVKVMKLKSYKIR